jgi:hypothetical protein
MAPWDSALLPTSYNPVVASSFAPILALAGVMRAFDRPWFVSGGWAIDLFLGRVTREHGDVEVGVYRRDQARLHEHLHGWTLEKVDPMPTDDGTWKKWAPNDVLELPDHQARARKPSGELREFEIFLNESTPAHWTSRRHPDLLREIADVWMTGDLGVPFLPPDVQLLYKAKCCRPKDERDFEHALPPYDREAKGMADRNLETVPPRAPLD